MNNERIFNRSKPVGTIGMKAERWLRKPRKEPTDWDEVFDIDHIDVKIKWVSRGV